MKRNLLSPVAYACFVEAHFGATLSNQCRLTNLKTCRQKHVTIASPSLDPVDHPILSTHQSFRHQILHLPFLRIRSLRWAPCRRYLIRDMSSAGERSTPKSLPSVKILTLTEAAMFKRELWWVFAGIRRRRQQTLSDGGFHSDELCHQRLWFYRRDFDT